MERPHEIEPERVHLLNDRPRRAGQYVLYWMQASQRAEENAALEFAAQEANRFGQPLVAYFGLTSRFPEANERHYAFMLEGLQETQTALRHRGAQLVVRRESPPTGVAALAAGASLLVTDRGYTRLQKRWRARVARVAPCRVVQVECDVVVPVETASPKEEVAARTLRPKVLALRPRFLLPVREIPLRRDSLGLRLGGLDLTDIDALLASLRISRAAPRVRHFVGGTSEAKRRLADFLSRKLRSYDQLHNDPGQDYSSHLSPYLHFGQISPAYVAREARAAGGPAAEGFLEQLIVRRELAANFVHYHAGYDSWAGLPEWARATLAAHRRDKRPALYPEEQLARAETADPYWNAAQREMLITGKMHGYMRMYWGKRLIEWTANPRQAFEIALRLNNRFELDGRDPNGFAGVAWCFGKHDRPWPERPIFGTVRFMSAAGLARKFSMDAYLRKVDALAPPR